MGCTLSSTCQDKNVSVCALKTRWRGRRVPRAANCSLTWKFCMDTWGKRIHILLVWTQDLRDRDEQKCWAEGLYSKQELRWKVSSMRMENLRACSQDGLVRTGFLSCSSMSWLSVTQPRSDTIKATDYASLRWEMFSASHLLQTPWHCGQDASTEAGSTVWKQLKGNPCIVSQVLFTECLTCAMHRIRNSPVLPLPTIPRRHSSMFWERKPRPRGDVITLISASRDETRMWINVCLIPETLIWTIAIKLKYSAHLFERETHSPLMLTSPVFTRPTLESTCTGQHLGFCHF